MKLALSVALILWLFAQHETAELRERNGNGRIIGGEDATRGEFPWQVSIQLNLAGTWVHQSGGIIRDARTIITAAHSCVPIINGNLANWRIIAGAHVLSVNGEVNRQTSGIDVPPSSHPNYNNDSISYDVCKITLSTSLDLSRDGVQSIRICDWAESTIGSTCIVSGWGNTANGVTGDTLKKTTLEIYSTAICEEEHDMDESKFCAWRDGSNICDGDSGGPFVCRHTTEYCLAGVASYIRRAVCVDNEENSSSFFANAWQLRAFLTV